MLPALHYRLPLTLALVASSVPPTLAAGAARQPVEATLRDGVANFFSKLQPGAEITVAYLGASITNGAGASSDAKCWRRLVHAWLEAEYPETAFRHSHVVNGGTGSDLGACRIGREVLATNPDLIFIEFSVNDGGASAEHCVRTMEGMVRQIWRHDPTTDIVILHTLAQGFLDAYGRGVVPPCVEGFEAVADHYGVPSINVGWIAAQMLLQGEIEWDHFSVDSCHPTDLGYALYTDAIVEFLRALRDAADGVAPQPHALREPLDAENWENARLLPHADCELSTGWRRETAPHFAGYWNFPDMIVADRPGDSISFRFRGTDFGLYHVIGPDSGMIEVVVDGASLGTRDLWDPWCTYYRSACHFLASGLADSEHDVVIRIAAERNAQSSGSAVRLGFVTLRGEPVPR